MLDTLVTVVTASLAGSLHCAAMCGGLVSFTCGTSDRPRVAQGFYHGSRLAVYASLGGLAGYAGQSLNQHLNVAGYQNLTGLVSGGAMIGWALLLLLRRRRSRTGASAPVARPLLVALHKPRPSRLSAWFARLHTLPSALRGALLGLTSAVLPCGWLYAFVTAAAGQGAPTRGALLMGAFWLGTLPMLIGLGGLISLLGDRAQRYLPQVSILVLLVLGLGTVAFRHPASHVDQPDTGDAPAPHSCH